MNNGKVRLTSIYYSITHLGLTAHTTLTSALSLYKDRNLVVFGMVCIPYSVLNCTC